MRAVSGEQNQYDEVGDQQRHIETVGVVNPAERRVEKVLAYVGPDAPRRKGDSAKSEIGDQEGVRSNELF